ncbi:MAG TPA: hypothetical protein VG674_27830 [Amycolatopsis sp.]|nr:hypothetical protein [Amycolatopsis sp.]
MDVAGRSDLRASAATGLRVGAALAHANVANRLESSPRDTPVRADSAQLSAARQQPGEDATQLADEALPHVARPRANLVTVDERPPSRQVVGALLRDS